MPIHPRQRAAPIMTHQCDWLVGEPSDHGMNVLGQRHQPVPVRGFVALSVSSKIRRKDEVIVRQSFHGGPPGEPAFRETVEEHHRRLPGIPRRGYVQADAVGLHLTMFK